MEDSVLWMIHVARVDVNEVSENGDSPLHIAIRKANVPIVYALIEAGADVNMKGGDITPLDRAIKEKENSKNKEYDLIIEALNGKGPCHNPLEMLIHPWKLNEELVPETMTQPSLLLTLLFKDQTFTLKDEIFGQQKSGSFELNRPGSKVIFTVHQVEEHKKKSKQNSQTNLNEEIISDIEQFSMTIHTRGLLFYQIRNHNEALTEIPSKRQNHDCFYFVNNSTS